MSNLIRIKRSSATASPASLQEGELAYSYNSDRLFVGNTSNLPIEIGGRWYTDRLNATAGTLTASKALVADANSHMNELRTATLRIGASGAAGYSVSEISNIISAGSSNTQLATAKAVYDYVAGLGASSDLNGLTDVTLTAAANGQIMIYNGVTSQWENKSLSGDITINATGATAIGSGVIVDDDISGSAAIQRTKIANGTANHVVINNGSGTLTSEAQLAVSRGGLGISTIPSNGAIPIGNGTGYVSATITGTANQIGVTNGAGSITLSLPSAVTTPGSLTVTTTLGVTGAATFSNTVTVSSGLTTLANVNASTANVATLNVSGNATVQGDLTVNGTLVTLDVNNLTVEDPLIALARLNTASDTVDIGFFGTYDPTGSQDRYTGLFRDATDGKYKLFANTTVAPTTTVDTAGAGYTTATLVANIESSSVTITGGTITGITDLAVADGGTGLSALTLNGVMFGSSTSAIGFATGTTGQVLTINSSGVPTFSMLDGGSF